MRPGTTDWDLIQNFNINVFILYKKDNHSAKFVFFGHWTFFTINIILYKEFIQSWMSGW